MIRRTELLSLGLVLLLASCEEKVEEKEIAVKIEYPETRMGDVQDNYFGTNVADPYRWLENDTAAEVEAWVEAQNAVTNSYLARIPYRDELKNRLSEIWNYERYGTPFVKKGKFFYFKNDGLQNQSVLYVKDGPDGEPRVLLDPNALSADGTVALSTMEFSKNADKLGYAINRSGSDWQEIYVLDVANSNKLSDSIQWAKFSGIAWQGDGFYYSRYDEPTGSELSQQNENMKVYYHKLGTPQSADKLIFSDAKRPRVSFDAQVTDNEQYLIMYAHEGASTGNELFYKDLTKPNATFKKIFDGFESERIVIDNVDNKLLVKTNQGAPNYRLVLVDPAKPEESNWTTILPETKDVLEYVTMAGGKIFAVYMQDASNHVYQYDISGKLERKIDLPSIGAVSGFEGEKDAKEIYYSFTSFTYPTTVFKYNIETGASEIYRQPQVKFNPDDYTVEQKFFTSKDGTKVPMFIVYKKGLEMDGTNPTYLYAYGGFNISLNPTFSPARIVLLENGGVFAMANLRGGGEYGENWHKGGMLDKKQNVFDDFIAAAEYLINQKYTSSEKLAIAGGSNGGLLVGATMTQRPELMKVAFPAVGVLDMLRFHKFTIGHAWTPEYGSSDDSAQFQYLYKYSPLHNIKEGVEYPATMVTTADHDDRVVPAHSFKFIAELQRKHQGENPVLIRIDTKAGHGRGKPTAKQIEEWADIWSFMFYNMGVTPTATNQQ